MNTTDFLSLVWPKSSHYLVAHLNAKGGFTQKVFPTIEAAAAQALQWDSERKEVYYAVGALKSPGIVDGTGKLRRRTAENIEQLKTLIADIDVGAGKQYVTQSEALLALKQFCRTTGFPKPSLAVSSGGGLHIYWILERAVSAAAWKAVALKLKEMFVEHGLHVDGSRTADPASVLRVVGTHNYKRPEPRPVETLFVGTTYKPSLLRAAIETNVGAAKEEPPSLGASNMDKYADVYVDFRRLVTSCAQVRHAAEQQAATPEPVWYAVLQLVRFAKDPMKAAHLVSRNHPTYSAAETERRVQRLISGSFGPTKCSKFQDASINPQHALCSSCPAFGQITTPAQLAPTVVAALPAEVELEINGEIETVTIPNPPEPFVRTTSGKIVMRQKNADGDEIAPAVVSHYDMYPIRGTENETTGHEHSWWRVKLPVEGWKDVELRPADVADPRCLAIALMGKGIYLQQDEIKLMVRFMTAYLKQLRETALAERTFSRVGWRDERSLFVLGDVAYHSDGTEQSHKTSAEVDTAFKGGLTTAGSLDAWQRAIQFYNQPGYEGHRFFLYAGFGSALMPFTDHNGVLVNASGNAGNGKTTALLAIASVWGDPKRYLVKGTKEGSTMNGLFRLMGIHNNLPMCLDDVTTMDPEKFADLCMNVTQGQGKARMTRGGLLNTNVDHWCNMVLSTANTDGYTTLMAARPGAEAEAVRLVQIEFKLPNCHTKQQADTFIHSLYDNYGHAGHAFARWIVQNHDEVAALVRKTIQTVDTKINVQPRERFWSAAISAAIAGAIVARDKCGLLKDFPIEKDLEWLCGTIDSLRVELDGNTKSDAEILVGYFHQNVGTTLVVEGSGGGNIMPKYDHLPRIELKIRHDVTKGIVYVTTAAMRELFALHRRNYNTAKKKFKDAHILVDERRETLNKGTNLPGGQVRCWVIDEHRLNGIMGTPASVIPMQSLQPQGQPQQAARP